MRTVGVEEELLLVNAESGIPRSVASRAIERADATKGEEGGSLDHELQQQQVETDTPPRSGMEELDDDVREWRRTAIAGARRAGARVIAAGTSPVAAEPKVDLDPRYLRIIEHIGLTAREQLLCACHVHVSVESDDEGVGVLDRIRNRTGLLTALSANSPFWNGVDSGYASFRSQAILRWPTSGPQDLYRSAEQYHALIDTMLGTGVMLDEGMVYFDSRLSSRYPTVEIRVADVCSDVRDTVLIAALARGLVDTAAREWADGEPPAEIPTSVIRLANWQAGRFGLSGDLLDPMTMEPRLARDVITEFVDTLRPALRDNGDEERVDAGIARLFDGGTGADRQRASLEKTGRLSDVISYLARVTAAQDE
ncbi:glutamate--cysteine ligase [Paramicrobacterium agarici]|uniref:glutamate--cysteine ligase n=1 Tax=Paramicrobacterium agarici TaxID=630514 RepID=UPI00115338B1|nr:glutamate--cysteine ligase [Microbacterium agarici]TQO22823.1 carboxylate-amine ligase [Microbacterium agarici]